MKKYLVKAAPHIFDMEEPENGLSAAISGLEEETFLRLNHNEATVTPSPLVARAISESLNSLSLNHYPDFRSKKLRTKLSNYTGVEANCIACYSGMSTALDTLVRTYLQPGDEAITDWPAERMFKEYAVGAGARVISAKQTDSFKGNIEEITAYITSKTKLIYLPNPNSISGSIITEAGIVFLLSYAKNVLVVIDESYFEFYGLSVVDLIAKYSNLTVIRTFSKAFALAGCDVAYLLTDADNLQHINRLGYYKGPDALAQIAAEAAIDDINYTANYVHLINESKKMLSENLTRFGYDFRITPANFFLLKINDINNLTETLTENKIFINNLLGIPGFDNYVRITIGTPSQTGVLLDILAKSASGQIKSSGKKPNRIKVSKANQKELEATH
ncbi:MAG: aminotransferase class I/II-fold pyridoxal phosphate-dependent enzyme [candidate division Zixibacteria bacterium]|nr:aminotransferase class I/II-fold pyridoxal phosphate-dependent enzyme [candidate division Zixibacteria bacterium]